MIFDFLKNTENDHQKKRNFIFERQKFIFNTKYNYKYNS